MTEFVQKFLLKNTKGFQRLVNEKLAKGNLFPHFFKWMEIGPRNAGRHVITPLLKVINQVILGIGYRWNFGRPHITKAFFSREKEIFLTGYTGVLLMAAFWARKNRIRPLFMGQESHLYHYDNPNNLSKKYGVQIPSAYTQFRVSAHYLEINKIFSREMLRRLEDYNEEVVREFNQSSERVKRTKYLGNKNYVYEPFGWEAESN